MLTIRRTRDPLHARRTPGSHGPWVVSSFARDAARRVRTEYPRGLFASRCRADRWGATSRTRTRSSDRRRSSCYLALSLREPAERASNRPIGGLAIIAGL